MSRYLVLLLVFTTSVSAMINPFFRRHDDNECFNDREQLFSILNELKTENVRLKHAQSNWRINMFAAASRIKDLEDTIVQLQTTNIQWAQRVNNIKSQRNEEKAERVQFVAKQKKIDSWLFNE